MSIAGAALDYQGASLKPDGSTRHLYERRGGKPSNRFICILSDSREKADHLAAQMDKKLRNSE